MLQVNLDVLPVSARARAALKGERSLILRSAAAPATQENFLFHDLESVPVKSGDVARVVDNGVIGRTQLTLESMASASIRT